MTSNSTSLTANSTEANLVFQLKGSLFTLTVLHLLKYDMPAFEEQLKNLIKQTPKFFHFIPLVLDLQKINTLTTAINFEQILQCTRALNIILVGVRGGSPAQHKEAQTVGLAIFPNAKTLANEAATKPVKASANTATKLSQATAANNTKLITQPVRSGQQVYARDGDLIVLAPVSNGAELLADGNIHVYGTLRGRALAGVMGNQHARIFCQSLEADLVSIAGHYWVNEDLQNNKVKQNVHIYLEKERLQIKNLY